MSSLKGGVYIDRGGWRQCRICKQARDRADKRRSRAVGKPGGGT